MCQEDISRYEVGDRRARPYLQMKKVEIYINMFSGYSGKGLARFLSQPSQPLMFCIEMMAHSLVSVGKFSISQKTAITMIRQRARWPTTNGEHNGEHNDRTICYNGELGS
ncbi:hypothetical protein JCM19000A_00490 [Silvimonas sp. JCM 19000]